MPHVDTGFASTFVLASQWWGTHRVSARTEYFETTDRDRTPLDDNTKPGTALTAADIFRPAQSHLVAFEMLQQAQMSYRVFF
jgi:hypothetical protein